MPDYLDLTNKHLTGLTLISIDPALTEIDLTCNRLETIDPRILELKGLRSINFRQNLLADVSSWSECGSKEVIEDIEFRDNLIKDIPPLDAFASLTRFEFSYNEIRSTATLTSLQCISTLRELYVANNKINEILAVSHLTSLRVLELGSNRIKTIEKIESLVNLEELWLGKNRISKIEGLGTLTKLKKISVQSNRLESMMGLELCTSLEELYLSHNGIWRIEGLSTLTSLNILDLSSNRISAVEGLEGLTCLEDLWLNDNKIDSLDPRPATVASDGVGGEQAASVSASAGGGGLGGGGGLPEALSHVSASLTTIYLEGNPAAKDPEYTQKMRAMLPNLTQLDANPVR